jgi:RNA polymerase sigma factor (sigma-70 family)
MAPLLAHRAGVDRAFERLYRRHALDVYRYAQAVLRNPADAEDVTQTTFMNAYRAYKRGEEIEKPKNWLIKIAHNAARNRYARATRRVREVPLEDHLEQLAVPEPERPNVGEVLEALGRLPFNQRAALVMRELEGRSYAEIADTLGVSVAAVETLIFRARRSLRVNASAVRVLSVVPVPGSLSQLLGAGGVAAGGGAVVGSGFLFKAAVAIIAGVVASGVNSDRPRQADAAPVPAGMAAATGGSAGLVTAPAQAASLFVDGGRAIVIPGVGTEIGPIRQLRPADEVGSAPAAAVLGAPASQSRVSGSGGAASSSLASTSSPAATVPSAAISPGTAATTTTQAVTTTVENAVPLPAPAPVPAPPPVPVSVQPPSVQVPPPVSLPPPPVSLPLPPPLPLP